MEIVNSLESDLFKTDIAPKDEKEKYYGKNGDYWLGADYFYFPETGNIILAKCDDGHQILVKDMEEVRSFEEFIMIEFYEDSGIFETLSMCEELGKAIIYAQEDGEYSPYAFRGQYMYSKVDFSAEFAKIWRKIAINEAGIGLIDNKRELLLCWSGGHTINVYDKQGEIVAVHSVGDFGRGDAKFSTIFRFMEKLIDDGLYNWNREEYGRIYNG
jgi:hypothetical protein